MRCPECNGEGVLYNEAGARERCCQCDGHGEIEQHNNEKLTREELNEDNNNGQSIEVS